MKLPYKLLLFKARLKDKQRLRREKFRLWNKNRRRFKYKLFHRIRTLNERLKQLPNDQHPKTVMMVWTLDVLQYGVTGAIVAIIFFERLEWNNVVPLAIAIGISKWWFLDFVKQFKRRMVE